MSSGGQASNHWKRQAEQAAKQQHGSEANNDRYNQYGSSTGDDRWSRDRFDNRDAGHGNRSNRSRGRGGGRAPRASLPTEQGFVRTMKESFGFLTCVEREGDLFFHYDEVERSILESLQIGDEVEFTVKSGKDGRNFASGVRLLPKGTVQLDRIDDQTIRFAVVTKEFKRPRHDNKGDRPATSVFSGRIHPLPEQYELSDVSAIYKEFIQTKPKYSEQSPLIPYGERGLVATPSNESIPPKPQVGDVVQYVTGIERSSSFQHALNVQVVLSSSDFMKQSVEEQLAKRSESEPAPKLQGVIKELHGGSAATGRGGGGGRMAVASTMVKYGVIQTTDPTYQTVSFRVDDLPASLQPTEVAAGATSQISGSWRSSPSHKRDSPARGKFGARDWRMDNDEEPNAMEKIHVGMPVEFTMVSDPRDMDSYLAVNIKALPTGSVTLESMICADVVGVVLTKHGDGGVISIPKAKLKQEKSNSDDNDGVEPVPNSSGMIQLQFTGSDVITPGPGPTKGDSVCCDVVKSKVTGEYRAVRIYVSHPAEEEIRVRVVCSEEDPFVSCIGRIGRETGVVTTLRDTFGFIRCSDREGDIYFPYNEVLNSPLTKALAAEEPNQARVQRLQNEPPLAINDAVSFTVAENGSGNNSSSGGVRAKKLVANRVLVLPRGSAPREVLLESGVCGEIVSPATTRAAKPDQSTPKSGDAQGFIKHAVTKFVSPFLFENLRDFSKQVGIYQKSNTLELRSIKPAKGSSRQLITRKNPVMKSGNCSLQILHNEQSLVRPYVTMLGLECNVNRDGRGGRPGGLVVSRPNVTEKVMNEEEEPDSSKSKASVTENTRDIATSGTEETKPDAVREEQESDGSRDNDVYITTTRYTQSSISRDNSKFKPGDQVIFDLVVDKVTLRVFSRNMRLAGQEAKCDQVGVVACMKEEGFGFIQSVNRNQRVFFHVDEVQGTGTTIQPGDYVQYRVEKSKRGIKALDIRAISETVPVDVVESDRGRVRGFIVVEPKPIQSQISTFRSDCDEAIQVAASQLPQNVMGKVVVADTFEDADPVEEQVDWRREGELRSRVRASARELDDNTTAIAIQVNGEAESKVVKQFARKESLFVMDVVNSDTRSVVVAKSKKNAQDLAAGQQQEQGKQDSTKSNNNVTKEVEAFWFTLQDIASKSNVEGDDWIPVVGDKIEFNVGQNVATKRPRALNITLVKGVGTKQQGIIDRAPHPNGGRFGFVRPHVAGHATQAIFGTVDKVDEAFKPGSGGRDGSIKFDVSDVRGGTKFDDGDEVEYLLIVDPRTKVPRATRVKLLKKNPLAVEKPVESEGDADSSKAERKVVNKALQAATINMVIPRFVQAKGPDGTNGFELGRGRNRIPKVVMERAAQAELRPDAKEYKPGEVLASDDAPPTPQ